MKHIFASITLLVASAVSVSAQLTASQAFVDAPQKVFPLLDHNVRMDMVDYFNSGLETPSGNALNGQSVITELTPSSVSVKMTDSSTSQLTLLPAGNDTIIAIVSTVAAPGLDSNIRFFNRDWTPIPDGRCFSRPGWDQWLNDNGKGHRDEVMMQVPFMLASYVIDPVTGVLTVTNNLGKFLDEDVYEMVAPYLQPQLSYTWNGKKYQVAK